MPLLSPEEETELALKIQAGGPDGEKAKQRLSEATCVWSSPSPSAMWAAACSSWI